MSLQWRFLLSFLLLIVTTIVLVTGIDFLSTRKQLDDFIKVLGKREVQRISQDLSRSFTLLGNWDNVQNVLSDAGFLYKREFLEQINASPDKKSAIPQSSQQKLAHIVIVDPLNNVIYDNFYQKPIAETTIELQGYRSSIIDYNDNRTVGFVHMDLKYDYLEEEADTFFEELFYQSSLSFVLVGLFSFVFAFLLAKYISNPIVRLTRASRALAEQKSKIVLPVSSSDELGQMSKSFNSMVQSLEEQQELRTRLLSDISHELKTPLSIIQLEAHGLKKGLEKPGKTSDKIINEVQRLRTIVSDLNWIVETNTGEQRLSLELCSIKDILSDEIDRWKSKAAEQQVKLQLHVAPKIPMFFLDVLRIFQVLGNIIRNSLQHSNPGGQISVQAQYQNKNLKITIHDDGTGIEASDLPHIFDRFYRIDKSRSRSATETRGTGLGLAITQSVIEAHNGTISAESEGLNKGTTIRITIPWTEEKTS